jgi:hypothetical protein
VPVNPGVWATQFEIPHVERFTKADVDSGGLKIVFLRRRVDRDIHDPQIWINDAEGPPVGLLRRVAARVKRARTR